MGYRITKRDVKPSLTAAQAFAQQRQQEYGSARLRNAVKNLLDEGKASTEVVGEVFDLILRRMDGTARITRADVERVLPGFSAD